jgi:hypothetical protein
MQRKKRGELTGIVPPTVDWRASRMNSTSLCGMTTPLEVVSPAFAADGFGVGEAMALSSLLDSDLTRMEFFGGIMVEWIVSRRGIDALGEEYS